MLRWFQQRPAVAGFATIMLVGGVSLFAATRDWSAGERAIAILGASVGAGLIFVAGPSRARRSAERERRERVARTLADAGHASGPALDEEADADLEAALAAVGRAVPLSRAQAEVAEAARAAASGVLESIRIPVLGTDVDGRIVSANAPALALLSVESSVASRGLTGRNIAEFITQREVLHLHRNAAAGRAGSAEIRWLLPTSGARTVEVTASPWRRGSEAVGVVMTMVDVTEVSEAARLRTDFVANASHELRTPLAAIKGAIETLESGASEEPGIRSRLLRMIAENSTRLEDLTRDLLDLSRLESTEAPIEVSTVRVAEVEASMRAQFAATMAQGTVGLAFRAGVSELRTDPRLLQLILRNLIENALKFAYDGTEVVVGVERMEGGIRWSVADRGIGIPLDQQQRIFERFYQVENSRMGNGAKGTGLGLAIVRHAVKSLDGTIRVESVWKEGTTMIVELPEPVEASRETA
jgi:two-component system phosphate regulon sensor histidine kinase PhoR